MMASHSFQCGTRCNSKSPLQARTTPITQHLPLFGSMAGPYHAQSRRTSKDFQRLPSSLLQNAADEKHRNTNQQAKAPPNQVAAKPYSLILPTQFRQQSER